MVTNNSSDYSPTQYNVQTGGANGTLNNVAPSSTSGVPIISQGSSSQPVFGTAVVAGGGTGATTFTSYAPVLAGTTTTGAFQSASTGLATSGYVLTSNGSSAVPSFQAISGSALTFDGDSGTAAPSGGVITFNANSNSGSSVKFTASSSTLDLIVTDANNNTLIGGGSGNGTLSGSDNTGLGIDSLAALTNGNYNTGIGFFGLNEVTSGSSNTGVGYGAGAHITTGSFNTAIGVSSLISGTLTGSYNTCVGYTSGINYTTSESNNILINSGGTPTESNVLRIGNGTGTGNQQLAKAFIYGITGVTPANIQPVSINSSTGQLGVTPTVATNFGTSAAPTGTTSTAAYVMMGLGSSWKITPTTFTSVRATINGQMANNTTGDGINIIISYGTGAAPSNGAGVTGTTVGINTIFTDLTGLLTNGAPFCKNVIITGLTPGTAYWIDIQCKAVTGGTASLLNLEFSAQELTS